MSFKRDWLNSVESESREFITLSNDECGYSTLSISDGTDRADIDLSHNYADERAAAIRKLKKIRRYCDIAIAEIANADVKEDGES